MSAAPSPTLVVRYRQASGALALGAAGIGGLVIIGWVFGLARLTDFVPSAPEAKFNAGACLVLCGLSLWLQRAGPPSPRARAVALALAGTATLVALLTMVEHLFGWDLGIDQLGVHEAPGGLGALAPGRMAPVASVVFLCLGPALMLLDARTRGGRWPANLLIVPALLATLFTVCGYVFGLAYFGAGGPGRYLWAAVPITIGCVLLCAGLLAARIEHGPMARFASQGLGGRLVRYLVPLLVLVPLSLAALLVRLEAAQFLQADFGLALFTAATIAITVALGLAAGGHVDRLEAAREASAVELSAARSRLLQSLDNLRLIAVQLDADGRLTYCNDFCLGLTGWRRDEVLGQDWFERFVPGASDMRAVFDAMFASGTIAPHYENPIRTRDGHDRLIAWDNSTIRDASGAVVGVLSIGEDITERKRAEAATNALNAELEERVLERTAELEAANKQLEAFSYSVSHDLRAPLRAIDGFSRILLDGHRAALPPEAQRYLDLVRGGAQQMGRLVDDLLEFSRLGRQAVRRERLAPEALVRQCLEQLAPGHEGRHVEVAIASLPECEADPDLLRQVWLNLLDNAFKFTRTRDPAEIRIGYRRTDGVGAYFVADNGVGFDTAYAHKLFGVFQRLHRSEDYEGTGVGLALVHQIVSRHGGRAWAESELDRGATFFFTLEGEADDGRAPG